MRPLELRAQRFGMVTALSLAGKDNHGRNTWRCRCDCGVEFEAAGYNLRSGNTASCGCQKSGVRQRIDITGQRFGRLTALKRTMRGVSSLWECSCECGGSTVASIGHLRSGHTTSCGCYKRQRLRESTVARLTSQRGPLHPRWLPHLTQEERDRRRPTPEATAWRGVVFARDNYSCRRCGKHGKGMNAHHIIPFSVSRDVRWRPENGVTLCMTCHRALHRRFGNGLSVVMNFLPFLREAQISGAPIPTPEDQA